MDSQSEIMSHPSDGCSMSSNITRCTNVKIIIIIITIIIMTSSFRLPRSASQQSLLSPLGPHTIYVYNPTQSHTIQQALKNSYTIPQTPIQSHTIPQTLTQSYTIRHNTIQSHTIPYNPTQSYTIPHNLRSSQGGRFLREGDPSTGSRRPAQKRTDRRVLSILETLSLVFCFVFKRTFALVHNNIFFSGKKFLSMEPHHERLKKRIVSKKGNINIGKTKVSQRFVRFFSNCVERAQY